MIRSIYGDLVEIEAIAITAEECLTMLPVVPSGKYKRTLAKLYTLVGKTADRACDALERGEELRAAHVAAQAAMLRAKRQR